MKTARLIAATIATAAATTMATATMSPAGAAVQKRKPTAAAKAAANATASCKIPSVTNAAAKHTVTFRPAGITAEDDWETPAAYQALCTNENVQSVTLRSSRSSMKFNPPLTAKVLQAANASGTFTHSSAFTFDTSLFRTSGTGSYSCTSGTCTLNAKLTKPGSNQIIAILIGLLKANPTNPGATTLGYELKDVIISSIFSPRDPQSGLPTGQ